MVLMFQSVLYGFCGVVLVFVACEMLQRFSNAFGEIDGEIEQLNWYLLPVDIQRILPTIKLYTQQAVAIEFFGSMSCCREQFQKVS